MVVVVSNDRTTTTTTSAAMTKDDEQQSSSVDHRRYRMVGNKPPIAMGIDSAAFARSYYGISESLPFDADATVGVGTFWCRTFVFILVYKEGSHIIYLSYYRCYPGNLFRISCRVVGCSCRRHCHHSRA
jgi:hypothetical protein